MKSYERQVIWLEYMDSERKRSQGRRVPMSSCVRSPTLDELTEACRRLGLEPEAQVARFPQDVSRLSGYVSVKKSQSLKKGATVLAAARELSRVRGERTVAQGKLKGKS